MLLVPLCDLPFIALIFVSICILYIIKGARKGDGALRDLYSCSQLYTTISKKDDDEIIGFVASYIANSE